MPHPFRRKTAAGEEWGGGEVAATRRSTEGSGDEVCRQCGHSSVGERGWGSSVGRGEDVGGVGREWESSGWPDGRVVNDGGGGRAWGGVARGTPGSNEWGGEAFWEEGNTVEGSGGGEED